MDTVSFLQEVLPTHGFYCLARPEQASSGQSYFHHAVFDSISELAFVAQEWSLFGFDVYYSMASLKQKKVYDPKKGKNGGTRVRTKANISALRCVFYEVDVLRPEEAESANEDQLKTKYATRNEALKETKKFISEVGLPFPMVVSSGGGFHFYWLLETEIEPSKYEVFAKKLKVIAKHTGYKLDPASSDMSRVFRVPGTYNYKDRGNPRKVEVIKPATKRYKFSDLESSIDQYIKSQKINIGSIIERTYLPDYLNFDAPSNVSDYPDTPMQLEKITEKCGAMREFVEKGGDVSYNYWLHALQVIRFCEGGRDLCHKISSGSNKYTPESTDKILDGLEGKDIRPTLCDTFAADPDCTACASCPYRNKVRSPAAFGRDIKSYKQNAQLAMAAAAETIPPPPYPFKHIPGKGVFQEVTDKEGNVQDELIFEYDMKPVKRVFSERDQRELTIWQTNNPADGFVEIEMPSSALYDKKAFQTVLADCGVYCALNKVDALRNYMVSYIQEIQRIMRKEMIYSRMGWRDDSNSFVLAGNFYQGERTLKCEMERRGRVVEAVRKEGTLEEWKNILRFFEHPDFAGHQFAIGTAFGAPLMPFTGVSGGILSLVGESGEGKSTVQKIVNSVWGHPTKLMLPAEARSSTYNAKMSFINQMNNLPICAEEITNLPADELGSLAYAITQGSEKWRADRSGNVRESAGGWCTTLLTSSNRSLHEKLYASEGAGAKALRVLEYRLSHVKVHSKTAFRQGVDLALMDHYGHAGHVYVAYLTQNLDAVKDRVRRKMAQIDTTYDMRPEERIWTAVIATNLVGLEIAKELGLHQFNLQVVEDFVASILTKTRDAVDDMLPSPTDILAKFISDNVGDILIVEVDEARKTSYVVQKPKQKLAARYDVKSGALTVPVSVLKTWCNINNISARKLIDELNEADVVTKRNARATLGAGTDIPSTQTRVVVFDAKHPAVSGTLRSVQNITSNIGVVSK